MQISFFDTTIEPYNITEELFEAYFDCRSNKRNTVNALAFEKYFEHHLFQLEEEVINGSYEPQRSIAFIVNKPVKREVFAADFRDRVVHHFLIKKLNPLFESLFINDSYACRVDKGTHFGINRVNEFIQSCSEKYTKDAYVLKLDIQGFFMHIDRNILYKTLVNFIEKKYCQNDKELILSLVKKIIFNDPTKNCIIKGSKQDWKDLPDNKSLFKSPADCGLPIGNLTSQVFANFYLHGLDDFIKKTKEIKYYGRYVDDFVIVHQNKDYLKNLISEIALFLKKSLHLTLHPNKIYLQHYSKGVKFLGTIIKPNRIYIANRTKGNFFEAIKKQNLVIWDLVKSQNKNAGEFELDKQIANHFLSSMNAYLGIMKHYRTYRLRKRTIKKYLALEWYHYFFLSKNNTKFIKKKKPTTFF